MALLFMDGFDKGDYATKWQAVSSGSRVSTTRFSTGNALGLAGASGYAQKTIAASAQIYTGFAVWYPSLTGQALNNPIVALFGDAGLTRHMNIRVGPTGAVSLYRDNTSLLSSAAGLINANTWNYIEFWSTVADAGGRCTVKVNGSIVHDFTGDTRNGGTSTNIDMIALWGMYGDNTPTRFDDLYVCDSTGTTNNTFLGDVRVQTLAPAGAGSSTQLTPTGGANYTNVAETPDNTATYNSSSTVGNRDTYAMDDLVAGTTAVYGVQDNVSAWKADAGIGNIKAALKVGATVYYDSTIGLGTSVGSWYGAMRETNPATSTAWTPTDVNGIEFGAEVA